MPEKRRVRLNRPIGAIGPPGAPRAGFVPLLILVAAALLLPAPASAAPDAPAASTVSAPSAAPPVKARAKRQHAWHGYGFLPGYRPPERIEFDNNRARSRDWWYGPPRFYRGRWNGGGFGPCWTPTPIGPVWNCG